MPANCNGRYTEWPSSNRIRRFTLLYDKVCRQDILQDAWQRVKTNKGAAGVDNVDIDRRSATTAKSGSWRELEQELRSWQLPDCVGAAGSHTKARTAGEDPAVGHPDGEGPGGADGSEDRDRAIIGSGFPALFLRFPPEERHRVWR